MHVCLHTHVSKKCLPAHAPLRTRYVFYARLCCIAATVVIPVLCSCSLVVLCVSPRTPCPAGSGLWGPFYELYLNVMVLLVRFDATRFPQVPNHPHRFPKSVSHLPEPVRHCKHPKHFSTRMQFMWACCRVCCPLTALTLWSFSKAVR